MYQWENTENKYSCEKLSTKEAVVAKKDDIWNSFLKYKDKDYENVP